MALPPPAPHRQLKHRRTIDVQVFARGNGLWEVDARLTDTKTRDVTLAAALRPAGTPIHEMLLRLVVDEAFNIVEAGSDSLWMPYPGHCNAHGASHGLPDGDAYGALVGLNLMKGFRQAVRQRLGGVLGCTHITEMTQVLPTAVVQAFAGDVLNTREGGAGDQPPFQIDRCHALRSDGPAVARFYPRWHRPADAASSTPVTVPSENAP